LGTDLIQKDTFGLDEKKLDSSQMEDRLKINLKRIMKAELLNRFDEVIVFKQLNLDHQMAILNLLVADVIKTLKAQKVNLTVTLSVKKLLLKKGYSEEYGARSLRRILEKELLDKVAECLLQHSERPLKLSTKVLNDSVSITKS
jgi:ATP-dependent Clp protease ATP-binding subunit ClpA